MVRGWGTHGGAQFRCRSKRQDSQSAGSYALDAQFFVEHAYACMRMRCYFGKVDASEEFVIWDEQNSLNLDPPRTSHFHDQVPPLQPM